MATEKPACLVCQRDDEQTPLLHIVYQGHQLWICPEHVPVLIHNTSQVMVVLEERLKKKK